MTNIIEPAVEQLNYRYIACHKIWATGVFRSFGVQGSVAYPLYWWSGTTPCLKKQAKLFLL